MNSHRKKHPGFLFFCLFIVMIGYGLTLPVLAFYIERLALADGASIQKASLHVGLLTGIFALMQFFFAPIWGRWSDRVGRRPLFMIGLGGYAIFMFLFGIGTNLAMLYTARILGGIFGAAVLPAASAYVADVTSESDRGKGMAWLSSTIGFGVVTGPALGGFLSRLDFHFKFSFWHFRADDFSTPFFVASLLAILSLFAAMYLVPESLQKSETGSHAIQSAKYNNNTSGLHWKVIFSKFWGLLILSFLGYFALSLFEGTFALHGKSVMNFGPGQMGAVFMVCGLVMAVAQVGAVGRLIGRIGERPLLPPGFVLMGGALFLLMTTQNMALILFYVSLFAIGMALINPSLSSLVSKNAGEFSGTALGMQSAVISLGQAAGPVVGGLLFIWDVHVPYLLTALLMTGTAIILGIKNMKTVTIKMNTHRYLNTGQTRCYDTSGSEVPCSGSGQDAEFKKGISWPTPRFEQKDKTVSDNLTGLTWTQNANPAEFPVTWQEALDSIAEMNRKNAFGCSDWRLPNRCELRSLMAYQTRKPALPEGHPFQNVFSGWYWTSTTAAINTAYAWYIHMEGARMFYGGKEQFFLLWPVRGEGHNILPVTGQMQCYDTDGQVISCGGTGQDGEFRHGRNWYEPQFEITDNAAIDLKTGLCWIIKADLTGRPVTWSDALQAIAQLNGKSNETAIWRLPNINEMESLVDSSTHSPALPEGHPFKEIQDSYWSSTTSVFETDWAWALYLNKGAVGVGQKWGSHFYVWPVCDASDYIKIKSC